MARVPLMSLGSGVVMTPGGLAIGGAQVLVVTHGTQSQVTVFAAEQGATALPQPLSTNNLGQIPGWVADGQTLDFQVTYAGVTVTQEADPVRGDDTLVQGAPESAIASLVADLAACEKTANKGIASGYASLDSGVLVPLAQIPALPESRVTGLTTDLGARALLTSNTFSGEQAAPDFKPTGLTGATQPTRYVGGTSAGPPTSGTFAVGDFVVDLVGTVWVCTVAGTPGTWVAATNSELAYAEITSSQVVPLALGDIPGLTITFPARTTAVELAAYFPRITKDTTASYVWMTITDSANFTVVESVNSMLASGFVSPHMATKVTGLTPGTSYTYKVRGITGAGVTTINAASFASGFGQRPFLRAWSA